MKERSFYITMLVYSFSLVFTLALLVVVALIKEPNYLVWWLCFAVSFLTFLYSIGRMDKFGNVLRRYDSLYENFWALHKQNGDQTKIIENYIEKYEKKQFERSENAKADAALRCHIEPDEPWPRP